MFLIDFTIREKGHQLQCAYNAVVPSSKCTHIVFSEGWLHLFKKRRGFKCHLSHGESGDADKTATGIALPHLRQFAAQYSFTNIYNADEYGLWCSTALTSTIGPGTFEGRKKARLRASRPKTTVLDIPLPSPTPLLVPCGTAEFSALA